MTKLSGSAHKNGDAGAANDAVDLDTQLDLQRRAEIGLARRQRTKATIVQAAISLLGSGAGQIPTVDEIVAKGGVSRATFYNYFPGREELIAAAAYQLSHDFNQALEKSLAVGSAPDVRAATWIRQYLRRIQSNREWGWAVVNVSFNDFYLFGEETYEAARKTLDAAIEQKLFNASNTKAALDVALGASFAAALTCLRRGAEADHPEATAYYVLLALGATQERAKDVAYGPLPPIDF